MSRDLTDEIIRKQPYMCFLSYWSPVARRSPGFFGNRPGRWTLFQLRARLLPEG
jgi:hypothetical protein